MSENDSAAGYIIDKDIKNLTGDEQTSSGRIEILSGGVDGEDAFELESDIRKMEKMMHKHKEPTSFMWIVPTMFTEFYHEYIKKDDE